MNKDPFIDFGSVSNLNNHINNIIAEDSNLKRVQVKGEISNWKKYGQNMVFLRLKDPESEIEAVVWSRYWLQIKNFANFKDGDEVVAYGELVFWTKRGTLKLSIFNLKPTGLGVLFALRQKWYEFYQRKGYFRPDQKKVIPRFANVIGVVTAANSAAIEDIRRTIYRRYPIVEVILFPATVQGDTAKTSIEQAIKAANQYSQTQTKLDVLIVGRGGGSIEDLWAFNEPVVIEAIRKSKIPIVTGIGHEIDKSLSDLVADAAASTPTAAAERVTSVSLEEVQHSFSRYYDRFRSGLRQKLIAIKSRLDHFQNISPLTNWRSIIEKQKQVLTYQLTKFESITTLMFTRTQQRIQNFNDRINADINLKSQKLNQFDYQMNHCQMQLTRWQSMIEGKEQALTYQLTKFQNLTTVVFTQVQQRTNNFKNQITSQMNVKRQRLNDLVDRFDRHHRQILKLTKTHIHQLENQINQFQNNLLHLNPRTLLQKGYSLMYSSAGQVINSINNVKINDDIRCELLDGYLIGQITKKFNTIKK